MAYPLKKHYRPKSKINFQEIRSAATPYILAILQRWLPDGKIRGAQYYAKNPKRNDKTLGSFSVNIKNGKWSDFATGDSGGDIISLSAYLHSTNQYEAAQRVARIIGV